MMLTWGQVSDGGYEARAVEGTYRIVARGDEWCLEKPIPRPGRIGGFSTPAEAMAWGQDLHAAATGARVRTPASEWPTLDEFAEEIEVTPSQLRTWIAAHVGGSTSPRRRLEPAIQRRIRAYWDSDLSV